MRYQYVAWVVGVALSGFGAVAQAELLVDPVGKNSAGANSAGAYFGSTTVDYDGDVDRTFLSAYIAYGLNSKLDLFGAAALTTRVKVDGLSSGDGVMLAGGVRGDVPVLNDIPAFRQNGIKIKGYTQFLYLSEQLGSNRTAKWDASGYEISAGLLAKKRVEQVDLFGGFEITPISNIDVTVSSSSVGWDVFNGSLDRSGILTLRGGIDYQLSGVTLHGYLSVLAENSIMFGASTPF